MPAPKTYCNPINIDYGYCPIPDFVKNGKHRTTADPAIVRFQGDYYLFSTNQHGYWWSSDMCTWNFVERRFLKPDAGLCYDDLCAPAIWVMDDALHVIGSTYSTLFPIYKSSDPRRDAWEEAISAFPAGAWDPAFFVDDDGRLYLYHGSSNNYPIFGQEVDRVSLLPIGPHVPLMRVRDDLHGWERFGEANDNTFLRPFIEGPWLTKHNGKYYLQYGGPGTEFSGYADGVYVADGPLGPFEYQPHNPFSSKMGGYARGSGHGATYLDAFDNYWHVSTIGVCVKDNFERRIGMWPTGFDEDGVMFTNTAYGDYPTYLPDGSNADHRSGRFTGWMLLNYMKPVQASSTLSAFSPNFAVDEDIKTCWSAKSGDPGEWLQTDLGELSTVRAIQINYADQDAEIMGKPAGVFHRYVIRGSVDGESWFVVVDKSSNMTDVPHDYVELPQPVEARHLRIENIHVPTGKFAISGFRVFGKGRGERPAPVQNFIALRGESERRNAWLKWAQNSDATGYVIYIGVDPAKLYTAVMVYQVSEFYVRTLTSTRPYYFQIEAFNENGISDRSAIVKSE